MNSSYRLRRLRSIPKWNNMCTVSYNEFKEYILDIFPMMSYFRYKSEKRDRYYNAVLVRETKDCVSDIMYYKCVPKGIALVAIEKGKPPCIACYKSIDEIYKEYCKTDCPHYEMIIPYLLKNISFTINSNLIYNGERFINYDNSDELYFGLYNALKQKFVNDNAICSEIIFENVFNEAYLLMGYHYSNDIEKYISFIGLRISILFYMWQRY